METKTKGLSGSALKTIALICMLIDHTTHVVLANTNFASTTLFISPIDNKAVTIYNILRFIGRVAFPIYCFLLVEGYKYTSNKVKYITRLGVFALISEIPFNLAVDGHLLYKGYQNVFFTLALGLIAIYIYDKICSKTMLGYILIAITIWLGNYLKADYDWHGVCFILFMYITDEYVNKDKKNRIVQGLVSMPFFLSVWRQLVSFILIYFYNGKRGYINNRFLKYMFYAIYPVHLIILYIIHSKLSVN